MQLAEDTQTINDESQVLVLDLTPFGFKFSLKLWPWDQQLLLKREYTNGDIESLEGNIGFSIDQIAFTPGGDEWIASIPPLLVDRVKPFPETSIYMLSLAASNRNARQLLELRPALLYLICNEYPLDREKSLELCQYGQREILRILGFSHSKAALRFLDRIDITFDTRSSHTLVTRLLHPIAERYRLFSHYPIITHQSLQLDMVLPGLTGSNLAINLSESKLKSRVKLPTLLNDTLMMGVNLGLAQPMRYLRKLRTVEDVSTLHDSWIRAQNRKHYVPCPTHKKPYQIVFTGTEYIQPLTSYFELRDEGEEQRHCVGAYHARVLNDEYQVFKVTAPERVTMGVRMIKRPNGRKYYEIDQVQAKCNRRPLEETLQTLYAWLEGEKQRMNL
ncbi:MAG: PcfJ domain-containing protein [Photobacterium frigidiphilum]|uniref:PcfJ domain-containing protein n=1 Tax=Photobacterium frigidiphilum TaxID=264736 RepID=UPI003001AB7F